MATELLRMQLMTSDEEKIRIFENDPCGMVGFNSYRDEGKINVVSLYLYSVNSSAKKGLYVCKAGPRGVCTLPNQVNML